jgi:hypothetical protein
LRRVYFGHFEGLPARRAQVTFAEKSSQTMTTGIFYGSLTGNIASLAAIANSTALAKQFATKPGPPPFTKSVHEVRKDVEARRQRGPTSCRTEKHHSRYHKNAIVRRCVRRYFCHRTKTD